MKGDTQPHKLYTLDEVSEQLKVSRRTVDARIAQGLIRVTRLGKRIPRVTEKDLNAYIEKARGDARP